MSNSRVYINSGLLPATVAKETTFGEVAKDFGAHDGTVKGLPIPQSLDTPFDFSEVTVKEVVASTVGSQVQKDTNLILGAKEMTGSGSHQLNSHGAMGILGMFFQNGYTFTEGVLEDDLNTHEMYIEKVNECGKQYLDNSYTFYLPTKFPSEAGDNTCSLSTGDIAVGVVPQSLSLDFIESTFNFNVVGKSYNTDELNEGPLKDADYLLSENEQFFRKEFGTLEYWDETEQDFIPLDTKNLTLDINFTVNTDNKIQGELARAVVDGVELTGTYSTLMLTEDDKNNISNKIFDERNNLTNGGLYRLSIANADGSSISIEGNLKFTGEIKKNKTRGGWTLDSSFQFLRNTDSPDIKLTVVNDYDDLTDYM